MGNNPPNINLSVQHSLLNAIRHFTEHSEYGSEQESYSPSVNLYFSEIAEQIAIKPNKRFSIMTSNMRQKIIGQVREGLSKEVIFTLIQNRRSETLMGRALPDLM